MPWTVKLIKAPKPNHFKEGYFPRTFAYKGQALVLVATVKVLGGEAVVEKDIEPYKCPQCGGSEEYSDSDCPNCGDRVR